MTRNELMDVFREVTTEMGAPDNTIPSPEELEKELANDSEMAQFLDKLAGKLTRSA